MHESRRRQWFGGRRGMAAAGCLLLLSACSGRSSAGGPAAPSANGAPVVASIFVSPSGMGLQSATLFAFAGQGISDPDGDALTYAWTTDGAAIASAAQTATHMYPRSGSFDVRLTVTDAKGLASSASATVVLGTLTGTWDLTCTGHAASLPSQFVVTMTQNGALLSGTLAGGGLSQDFPAPASVATADTVSDPRHAVFGVEAPFNVWGARDAADFYFHLDADAALTTMTGTSQLCETVSARRR